mgnify:CR=1 FL=1
MLTMAGQALPKSAADQGRYVRSRSNKAVLAVHKAWQSHSSDDFDASYAAASGEMLAALDSAQSDVIDYMSRTTPDVMLDMGSQELGQPEYGFDYQGLIGLAGNGIDTCSKLGGSVLMGKRYVGEGD